MIDTGCDSLVPNNGVSPIDHVDPYQTRDPDALLPADYKSHCSHRLMAKAFGQMLETRKNTAFHDGGRHLIRISCSGKICTGCT